VGKGRWKERCGLERRTNFFPFKKSPKTECGLDSGADYIRECTVVIDLVVVTTTITSTTAVTAVINKSNNNSGYNIETRLFLKKYFLYFMLLVMKFDFTS
jgi:hypothetical protein